MTDRRQHITGFDNWAKISFAALFLLLQVPAYHVYDLSNFLTDQLLKSELVDMGFADRDSLQEDTFSKSQSSKSFTGSSAVFTNLHANWKIHNFFDQLAYSNLSNPVDRHIDHTHHRIYPSSDDQPENG